MCGGTWKPSRRTASTAPAAVANTETTKSAGRTSNSSRTRGASRDTAAFSVYRASRFPGRSAEKWKAS
jgi:hypothetical protein